MVKTITNIPHADYADKADYFKTLMTLIALIFFDSENMRNNEIVRKKCFTQITQISLNTNRSNNTNIFLIPETCERAKKFERNVSCRLRRCFNPEKDEKG